MLLELSHYILRKKIEAKCRNCNVKRWKKTHKKTLKQHNADVVGEKCIRNNEGKLTLTVDDKQKAWQSHYQKLLNVKFPWNAANISEEVPVEGPAIKITPEMVSKTISKMKPGKPAERSRIITEMINAPGDVVIVWQQFSTI